MFGLKENLDFLGKMLMIVRGKFMICCYCEPNWLGLCVFVS